MKSKYIRYILALVIIGIISISGCVTEHETISKVIDGDTVKLATGETIRLLGINAPEKGQPYYEEATSRLKELIEGKIVILERDAEDKDQYGRLLRYIFLNNENINVKMIKEGYANVYIIPPNTKYETELREAEDEAINANRGMWPTPENLPKCIDILCFHWNAKGDDCYNLNDEYVVFKDTCSQSIDMANWTVKDEAHHIYTFPSFVLESNAEVTLYTGCGTNTKTELYWCSSGMRCNAIWNNTGDTLYLRNANGELVLRYSYPGYD
jgi:micrococcal nuclease